MTAISAIAALEAVNLTKQFDDFTAVNKVNFTVQQGEIFGFLGPNGAGKTTTINMLTGLARPSGGEIKIGGKTATANIKAFQHLVGIVPDESNLYDDLSGYDNLCFCASLYGIIRRVREERARELLAQFDLEQAADRRFKTYSKGMKRKLTIAAGIIHRPQILFLDEPTTGIDVASARQIRRLITRLNQEGTTIFLTTHYIEEAERLCHRIAFIVEGRIVHSGSVEELMADVQGQQILELTLAAGSDEGIAAHLAASLRDTRVEAMSGNVLRLYSRHSQSLGQIVQAVEDRQGTLLEAKRVNPSLEEVFVRVTGIEKDKMAAAARGKGRKKR